MWKCGYRYLSCEKLLKICQLVPTLQIREQLVNICFFSAVSCSFLNASIHFLWTLNYAMTEYRVILLTANFSICHILLIKSNSLGLAFLTSNGNYWHLKLQVRNLQLSVALLRHRNTFQPVREGFSHDKAPEFWTYSV